MAQHTDPGAIPIGARPLPIVQEEEEGDETFLVSSALLSSSSSSPSNIDGNDNHNGIDSNRQHVEPVQNRNKVASSNESGDKEDKNGNGFNSNAFTANNSRGKKVERRRGVRRCRKCGNNYKPPRAHHDSVTGRCISKFDHFCPWVGNAVGALNHKFFVLFIFYTFLSSLISLLLLLMRYTRCGFTIDNSSDFDFDSNSASNNNSVVTGMSSSSSAAEVAGLGDNRHLVIHHKDGWWSDNGHHHRNLETHSTFLFEGCEEVYSIKVLFLLILSICFLVFTCCMLFEQIDAIESNTSKIARMKLKMGQNTDGEYEKVAKGFNEMFGIGICGRGSNVALHWFLPTPVRFPDDMERDRILGYEYYSIWEGKIYQEDEDGDDQENHNADNHDEEAQSKPLRIQNKMKHKQLNRGRKSSLMLPDSDHEGEVVMEIELPEGIGLSLEGSKKRNGSGTISRRSSGQSISEHSVAQIV